MWSKHKRTLGRGGWAALAVIAALATTACDDDDDDDNGGGGGPTTADFDEFVIDQINNNTTDQAEPVSLEGLNFEFEEDQDAFASLF